jgi:hypothetical protein
LVRTFIKCHLHFSTLFKRSLGRRKLNGWSYLVNVWN